MQRTYPKANTAGTQYTWAPVQAPGDQWLWLWSLPTGREQPPGVGRLPERLQPLQRRQRGWRGGADAGDERPAGSEVRAGDMRHSHTQPSLTRVTMRWEKHMGNPPARPGCVVM